MRESVQGKGKSLYPVVVNGIGGRKWGYIDGRGKIVIKPVYDKGEDFQRNGLAIVTEKNLQGLIDYWGNYIVPQKYECIKPFQGRVAIVQCNEGSKLIDEQGKILFNKGGVIGDFQEGLATFSTSLKDRWLYGYIDSHGVVTIPPRYITAENFCEGKGVVQLERGKYGLISPQGEVIRTFRYYYLGPISEGLMAFKSQRDSGYGFIDEGGKVVIAPNFNVVENFRNGRAIVKIIHKGIAPKYGLIDKRGKYIISPDYNDIYFVDKDRLAVGLTIDRKNLTNGSSQYAIADTDGRFLTGFDYYSISFYEKGISSVSNFVQTFFIDKAGKKLTSLPTVEGFGKLQIMEDRIKGDIDGRVRYFDLAGQIIWKGKGIISLSNKFLIKEKKFNPKQNYLVYYPQIIGMVNSATQLKTNKALKRASTQIISQSNLGKGYRGDYSLLFHKKNLLVICFSGASYSNGDNPKAQWQSYVHLNLINGKTYTLGDLFDQEIMYVKVLSKIIKEKINKGKEKSSFWSHKYKGIHPNQTFCIGENALQIFFKPGEIGPYSLGAPSFTIGFKEIISSINREGEFWQGFN